jgi:hypothetical protein
MHFLRPILLILPLSLSLNVLAADSTNTTEQRDKTLERRHSGETMPMRDCLVKNGNDKAFCENELANNPTGVNATDTPRRSIPNPNTQIRDDIKTRNTNPTDVQTPDNQLSVPRIEPLPPNNNNPSGTTPNTGTGNTGTGTTNTPGTNTSQ